MSSLHDLRRLQQIFFYFKRHNGEHLPEGCTRIELIDNVGDIDTEENIINDVNNSEGNISNWFVQFVYKDYNNSDFFVSLRISFSECTNSSDKNSETKKSKYTNKQSSPIANESNSVVPFSFMPMVFIISPRLHAPFIHHGTLCALEFMSSQWQLTTENISLLLLSLHHSLNPFTDDSKVNIEEAVMREANNTAIPTQATAPMQHMKKNEHVFNNDDDKTNYTVAERESHKESQSNHFTGNYFYNSNNNNNNNNNYYTHSANYISSYSSREHTYGMEHIRRCHPHLWRSYFHTTDFNPVQTEEYKMYKNDTNSNLKKKINNNGLEVETSHSKINEEGTREYIITTSSQLRSAMEEVESANVHSVRLLIDTSALLKECEEKCEESRKYITLSVYLPSHLQHELEVDIITIWDGTDDATNISCKQEECKLTKTWLSVEEEREETELIVLSFTNNAEDVLTPSSHCIIAPLLHLRLHNVFVRNHFIIDGKVTCARCTLQGTLIVQHNAQVSCTNTIIQVAMESFPFLEEVEKHHNNNVTGTEARECCQTTVSDERMWHKCKEGVLLLDYAEMELLGNCIVSLYNDCNNSVGANTNSEVSEKYSHHLNSLLAVYNYAKLRIVRSEVNINTITQISKRETCKEHTFVVHLDSVIRAEQSAAIDLVSSTIRADVDFANAAQRFNNFSAIKLLSASAYLYNVHIIGNDWDSVNEYKEKHFVKSDKLKINREHNTVPIMQTRGISAEYGAHIVLEHVWVEHFHYGIVLLEHCRAYCTHYLITNTEIGCVAHSALVEFDNCSIREVKHVAILLLKSSKCVVHNKERTCMEAQKRYSSRFYKALHTSTDKIQNKQNETEQENWENMKEKQSELLSLRNTELMEENVDKCTNLDCSKRTDGHKLMFTFMENVYESMENVVDVHHSTFIAHDVNFTNSHHVNISATAESVIELYRCVMYKTQCTNVECKKVDKATRASFVIEGNECEHCRKNGHIRCRCEQSDSNTQKNDNIKDNITDDKINNEYQEHANYNHKTDISVTECGVYISQSSITMHECSVMHYYCGVNLSHRSSATLCKCGALDSYIGFIVCHHSHAIFTHCGTHFITHTGVKLIDGSHVTMNGTAHDVTVNMKAQKERVKLVEPLPSVEPSQSLTMNTYTHKQDHCCNSHCEHQNEYNAIYTGRVQAIECHNSILRAHGVCIHVGQSSGVNAHGWSSNDNDNDNSTCGNTDNHNNKERWRDVTFSNSLTENVNSVTLEKCLIEQPTRCTVCRRVHTDLIHTLLEMARHTCKCHFNDKQNVKNINMSYSGNNENSSNDCHYGTPCNVLPPGVGVKMWSGVHGRLTECEVRHTPIGALFIGPTTQVEMQTSTFRHCTVALSVDGSLCKLHKCTSVDVHHTMHLSSSARAIIRRGSFHSHISGIRACDSSTLFLFGEVHIYGFVQVGLQAYSGSHIENDSSYNSNSKVTIIPCYESQRYNCINDNKTKDRQLSEEGTRSSNTVIKKCSRSRSTRTNTNHFKDNFAYKVNIDDGDGKQNFYNHSTWCVRVSTGGSIYLQNSTIGTTFKNERFSHEDYNKKSYDARCKKQNKHFCTHYINGVHTDTFGCLTLCHCIIQCSEIHYLTHHYKKGVNDMVRENEQEESNTFAKNENTLPLESDLELYQPVCVRVCNNGNVLLMSCVVWGNYSGMAMSVCNHGVCRVDGKAQMHNETQENELTNTSLIRGMCFVKESECIVKHTVIQPLCLAYDSVHNLESSSKYEQEEKYNELYSCFHVVSGAQCVIEHCELDLHVLQRHRNDLIQSRKVENNPLSGFTVNGDNGTTLSLHHMTIVGSNITTEVPTSLEESKMQIKLICASNGAHVNMHHVDINNTLCGTLLSLHLSSSSVINICEKTLQSLVSLQEKQKEKEEEEQLLQLRNEEMKSSECYALHSIVIVCNHAKIHIKSYSDSSNKSCEDTLSKGNDPYCFSLIQEQQYSTDGKSINAAQIPDKNYALIILSEHSVLESDINLSSLMCHNMLVQDVDSTNVIHYVSNKQLLESYALVHQLQRVWQLIVSICRKQFVRYELQIQNVCCKSTALLHLNVQNNDQSKIIELQSNTKVMEPINEWKIKRKYCQEQQQHFKLEQHSTNQRSNSVVAKVILTGATITLLFYSAVRLSSRAAR